MTALQEDAWRWFYGLVWAVDKGAPEWAEADAQLRSIRSQLTVDEYAVLCEGCRAPLDAARRLGRSRQSTLTLQLSALRKLVTYRQMEGA
jgi:hypothetical protein